VARAADRSLSVDQVVQLLGSRADIPNDPQVIRAVADLWIDYTLLAHALSEDPALRQLDLAPLVESQLEQEMILMLRDSVVQADTAISEAELADLFEREAPGVQAQARHILLTFPQGASPAQRDSVRAAAEALRQRVLDGESFAELAQRFSQDRGSGASGGGLGTFGRGELVRPLDEAVFALDEGEGGEVVESPYGYHVVRLDALTIPQFDSIGADFRISVQNRRFQVAESSFIAGIQESANLRPTEQAAELVRQAARDPEMSLTGRAADRVAVRYEGGTVTLEEIREFMLTRAPDYRTQVIAAPDDVIRDQILVSLAQRELLVDEARERGFVPSDARRDSLTLMAREQFVATGEGMGLIGLPVTKARPDGVTRAVRAILEGIITGNREVVPLGPISFILRDQYRNVVADAGVTTAVTRLGEIRGPAPAPQATPPQLPPVADTALALPDTAG